MDINDVLEQLPQRILFWEYLSEQERELVRSRIVLRHYAEGELVRGGDTDCLGMLHVVKGVLRAYLLSPDGREITLYRLRENESCVLSASCVLEAVSFDTEVGVEEECELLVLPIDVFTSLMKSNVYVERDIYRMTAERFSDVVAGVERMAFYNLEQRLVSFLLDESSSNKADTIHMTHEQIAVNIGSAREVVSRTLKVMAKKGWVELFRGGVELKDKPSLYKLVG